MNSVELKILSQKIESQKKYLEQWRRPIEPLLFETLRAIDNLFCRDLFRLEDPPDPVSSAYNSMSTWGVNKALARMVPNELGHGEFKLFPSTKMTQSQADEFLFQCGILERAELLHGWIVDGLVSARLDTPSRPLSSKIENILVLKSECPSLFREVVSRKHREWFCDLTMEFDRAWETKVEEQHKQILPELERNVGKFNGWGITYSTTQEIDDHFLEWGQIYLRRMWSQDLLGLEDRIAGNQFNDYLGVLAALSGRAQKHLCFASILKSQNPNLDLRNLLTTFSPYQELITSLARYLNADTLQIQKLLNSLTLEPTNKDVHTSSAEIAWAPIVRSSHNFCILPLYGLENNPFLFLLEDIKAKFPEDWFRAANNREKRWLVDLKYLFQSARWCVTDHSIKLREGRRTVTDIDFIAYDMQNNELAIFQLKWQQPVGTDNRARRSAGKNLISEGNRWIEIVLTWLEKHGVFELARRASITVKPSVRVELFVIARYNAFYSGFADYDERAVWVDWNHFMKLRVESPQSSIKQMAEMLKVETEKIAASFPGESYVVPISDLAIILNPTSEPTHTK